MTNRELRFALVLGGVAALWWWSRRAALSGVDTSQSLPVPGVPQLVPGTSSPMGFNDPNYYSGAYTGMVYTGGH